MALTIAGSDSGGGAGIQADLKTFAALGAHGTSAVTCITAQNPARVSAVEPCSPKIVRDQMEAVFTELHPAAVKTGMLYSNEIIRAVAQFLKRRRHRTPLVVDPVMISTSGKALLQTSAIKTLEKELLPLATLATPNLDETARLIGKSVRSVEEMREAARTIYDKFRCAALVKGGHFTGANEAVDIFYDGKTELLLSAPFVKGLRTHGTGCAYSAAIASYLALGLDLPGAVSKAKNYITQAIAQHQKIGRHAVLNHFAARQ